MFASGGLHRRPHLLDVGLPAQSQTLSSSSGIWRTSFGTSTRVLRSWSLSRSCHRWRSSKADCGFRSLAKVHVAIGAGRDLIRYAQEFGLTAAAELNLGKPPRPDAGEDLLGAFGA